MWQIDNLTLDGDKITQKIGHITLTWPNAYLTESFVFTTRFPLGEGNNQAQLALLVSTANAERDNFAARRTAEDALKTPILNALNP